MPWDLDGNANINPATQFLGTTTAQPLVIRTNGAEALRVNVADAPASRVEIVAQDGLSITGFQPFITLRDANAGNARSVIQGVDGDIVVIPASFIGSGAAMVLKTGSGNVGIGTSTPSSRLEIVGQDGLAISGFQPFITLRDGNAGNARAVVQGVGGDLVLIPESFIGRGAAMVVKTGSGDVLLSGNLAISRGKDITLAGADCAEQFEIAPAELEGAEPGTVMVVGAEGALEACRRAYDTRVAGVVSGAGDYQPGIVLDRRDPSPSRRPIALLGKAFCKVDASEQPVRAGDLLTTSETPGHAMRATDAARTPGAVLGKALRPLREGNGLIPILVGLR